MPPKKAKGGAGGGKKGGDGGSSSLHLNNRPIEATISETDIAKETQKLDSRVAKCKAGVAWVDLLAIAGRLKFGVYNDRPQNDAETNKLVGCFEANGIVSMKDVAAIPLIMKTTRLKDVNSLAKNFDEPDEVAELEIKDRDFIVVASGQHRLAALQRYRQSLQDEYDALEKKREKIRALKGLTDEHIASYNECHKEMCTLKGLLYGIGKWGVIIYDEDKLLEKDITLANHLSRNSALHEYKETEEEVLITIFKKIKAVYDASPVDKCDDRALEHLREIRTAQEKNARLHKVLHHDSMCVFLATRMLQLGPHIRHRREFTVSWLSKSIDMCMGIYLSWVMMRTMTLKRLGSKGTFPSHAEMSTLLDQAEARDAAAIAKVAELRVSIAQAVQPDDEEDLSMWASVMEPMDKHASLAFADISDNIGEMTPAYIIPLSSYRQNVVETLQDSWGLTSHVNYKDNEILAHLDRVVARVLLYLTPQEGKSHAPQPLLGGFVMTNAWVSFVKIKDGIGEVCRWFETLLDYYRMLHSKTHTMDDWSTVMMNNISRDPRFIRGGYQYTQKITNIIWVHRHTLMVRLTNYMIDNKQQLTPRAGDKKELTIAYEKLPSNETIASEALTKILQTKRMKGNKSRDLASEPQSIAGMMALHTTSWDWLSPTLKNAVRDIEPCMKAIAVERQYLHTYRPKMLQDKYIGTLRRLIEIALTPGVKKVQTINASGQLTSMQTWVWWDGLTLSETLEEPEVVLKDIKDSLIIHQRQTQERLVLENQDREAINKLVTYISNMSCAQASTASDALMSRDVEGPLQELITGLEVNSARLRARRLKQDPYLPINLNKVKYDLGIHVPDAQADKFTTGYSNLTARERAADSESEGERPAPKKKSKKGKGCVVSDQDTPVPEPDTMQPSSTAHSKSAAVEVTPGSEAKTPEPTSSSQPPKASSNKPRPRPVPRKQRQQSPPTLDDEIQIITKPTNAGDKSDTATHTKAPASSTDVAIVPPQSPAEATIPSSEGQGADGPDNHTGSDTLAQRTPSPPHGFSTTDTSWFDPDADDDHVMEDGVGSNADDNDQRLLTDIDHHPSEGLVPTQPLTQPSSPSPDVEHNNIADAAPIKRSRAATGNSSSSSTHGRGRLTKKKPKVVHAEVDDAEVTVIPGI